MYHICCTIRIRICKVVVISHTASISYRLLSSTCDDSKNQVVRRSRRSSGICPVKINCCFGGCCGRKSSYMIRRFIWGSSRGRRDRAICFIVRIRSSPRCVRIDLKIVGCTRIQSHPGIRVCAPNMSDINCTISIWVSKIAVVRNGTSISNRLECSASNSCNYQIISGAR